MDEQVPGSIPSAFQQMPKLSAEQIEMLKAVARERAIAQATSEQQEQREQRIVSPPPSLAPTPPQQQQPNVIYLRRNLTVAELILVVLLACGLVTGTQFLWNFGSRILPQIEIKVK